MMDDLSRRNLIINYLPQSLTEQELRNIFSSVGPLKNCKLIYDKATGYSFGYGFAEYMTADDAEKAIHSLNGMQIQNKKIKVAYARPNNDETKNSNLYIRGIPKRISDEEFEAAFQLFGRIIQCRVLRNPSTNEAKGVGFILYETHLEADEALRAMNGAQLPGYPGDCLQVKYADEEGSGRKKQVPMAFVQQHIGGPMRHGSGGDRGGGGGGRNHRSGGNHRFNPMSSSAPAPVYNNYYHQQHHDSPEPSSHHHQHHHHHQPPHEHHEHPQHHHQQHHQHQMMPSSIPTVPSHPSYGFVQSSGSSRGHHSKQNPYAGSSGGGSGGSSGGGRPPAAPGHIIYVYGIGPKCDETMLWNLFQPFGAITRVDIIRDQATGHGKGYGFVSLANYEEALYAIQSLNGFCWNGKYLQVSFKQ